MLNMATVPSQASRRNSSSHAQDLSASDTTSHDDTAALSTVSEDSQTVLLNHPPFSTNETHQNDKAQPPHAPPTRSSTSGVKKCWICICDSTEDDPSHPPKWRSPCTCNLTAHEACLLDWVATIENTRNKHDSPPKKIACPQCKSEIKVDRPTSLVLAGLNGMGRVVAKATLPGMIALLGSTVWAGCFYHGLHSVRMVFGEPQASLMLHRASRHWGWLSGYPLIPVTLIATKTGYADFVLPSSTIFLVATQLSEPAGIDWSQWPPQPSTVFACLPLIRSAYNYLYEKAFGPLNHRWLEEVRPRQMQEGNDLEIDEVGNPAGPAQGAEVADNDVLLELNLEIGMEVNDEADGEGQANAQGQPQAAAEEADRGEGAEAANDGQQEQAAAPQQGGEQGANPALLNRRPNQLVSDTASLFRTTASALLFPSVATGMGALLELTLPHSWTKPSPYWNILSNNGREQLLRTRWGRSVIGGCLFVALKDVLVLYARWRLARNHRRRKIMDWDRDKHTWVLND